MDMSAPLGVGTTRYLDRIASALGRTNANANIQFEANEAPCGAGVLFLLPALIAQGNRDL